MTDATSQLRTATRRAKSDVANKLISMFLHELSRQISHDWRIKVDSEEYETLVRERFNNRCPYCSCDLAMTVSVVEHPDGMNRYRAGLHVPGNVLVACKKCNGEKRRDDSMKTLTLAATGWESFLSHNGERCPPLCPTCKYWRGIWEDEAERRLRLGENLEKLRQFRSLFAELNPALASLVETLPGISTKLYSDCQAFAESEIRFLLAKLVIPPATDAPNP